MPSPAKTTAEGAPAAAAPAGATTRGGGRGSDRTPDRSSGPDPAPVPRETIHHPAPEAFDLAQILRTVGDPLRLAMVRDLAAHDELLCGALGDRLGLPKSTGSYHLRLLREAGLTRTRQDGTLRYVSLRRADLEARFPGLVDVLRAGDPR